MMLRVSNTGHQGRLSWPEDAHAEFDPPKNRQNQTRPHRKEKSMTRHYSFPLIPAIAAAAWALLVSSALAIEPLRCRSAKLSAQVRHAQCIVRCQRRPAERAGACAATCNDRLDRRIHILDASALCTGVTPPTEPNNDLCQLQVLRAAWKQSKCLLRCDRLAGRSDAFPADRCDDRCQNQFDRSYLRVVGQPMCSQYRGEVPTLQ
jgi:hypothetical protein